MVKDQWKLNLNHTEGKQQKEIIHIFYRAMHEYSKVDKGKDQDEI